MICLGRFLQSGVRVLIKLIDKYFDLKNKRQRRKALPFIGNANSNISVWTTFWAFSASIVREGIWLYAPDDACKAYPCPFQCSQSLPAWCASYRAMTQILANFHSWFISPGMTFAIDELSANEKGAIYSSPCLKSTFSSTIFHIWVSSSSSSSEPLDYRSPRTPSYY